MKIEVFCVVWSILLVVLVAFGLWLLQVSPEWLKPWQRGLGQIGGWVSLVSGSLCFIFAVRMARGFCLESRRGQTLSWILFVFAFILVAASVGFDGVEFSITPARLAIAIFGCGLAAIGALIYSPHPPCS